VNHRLEAILTNSTSLAVTVKLRASYFSNQIIIAWISLVADENENKNEKWFIAYSNRSH